MTTGFVDRARRRADRRDLQPVRGLRAPARAAGAVPARTARDARSCSSARRAGYRGARRHGDPVHVRAPADRLRAGGGDGDDRRTGRSRELGLEDGVLLWNVVPTHPRHGASRTVGRPEPRSSSRDAFLARARRRPPGRRGRPARARARSAAPYVRHPVARRRRGVRATASPRRCSDSVGAMERFPIRRNTILLAAGAASACRAWSSSRSPSARSRSSLVTGIEGILGLGPAIFLTAGALAGAPGRTPDRTAYGRDAGARGGCLAGIAGCLIDGARLPVDSAALVLLGLALVGVAQAIDPALARRGGRDVPAGAPRPRDLVRPLRRRLRRRARPARLRAALRRQGPRPGRARRCRGSPPPGSWSSALVLVLCVRPDPKTIAEQLALRRGGSRRDAAAPLAEILRRPGVLTALSPRLRASP